MLQLKLFGTGQASYSGRALPGFPGQQPGLLLCYLLLNRNQSHPREHLAAVFWGDYPTSTSRKYLRNALWRVRHLLQSVDAPVNEYLVVGDNRVSFSRFGRYWLDVEVFEEASEQCQRVAGRELAPEEVEQLEDAVELYTGDLLVGIYEDWCLYERERLNLLYLNALGKLMDYHEFNGNYEQGLAHGQRILACDNTRERVHRRMMRLYWKADNRGAALAQYKLCAQVLYESLGISPLEETTRLYHQMKYGQFDPGLWADSEEVYSFVGGRAGESVPMLAEHALQRVQQLQAIIDEAGAELRQIERQLIHVLARSWDLTPPSTRSDRDRG